MPELIGENGCAKPGESVMPKLSPVHGVAAGRRVASFTSTDGGKEIGVCAQKQGPPAAFPAHWAPNDMLIY
jgi:hypothetical protein